MGTLVKKQETDKHGTRQDQDSEEVEPGDHREVLLSPHSGLPDQQAHLRGGRYDPFQAAEEQDCWLCHASYEAHPAWPSPRHLPEAAGGERERRLDFVPDVSAVDTDVIEVDNETKALLRHLDMGSLPGIVVQQPGNTQW